MLIALGNRILCISTVVTERIQESFQSQMLIKVAVSSVRDSVEHDSSSFLPMM